MKKNFLSLFCLMSLLAVSSCGGSNTSSSTSSTSGSSSSSTTQPSSISSIISSSSSSLISTPTPISSSSSLISVNPTPTSTAQEVFNFLNKAATETNFTLEELTDEGSLHITFNPKYIYYDLSDAGYVAIQSYKDSNSQLLYNFTNAESPVIENAVAYTDDSGQKVAITSTQTLNALYDGMQGVTVDDIKSNWDYYYSKNSTLIEWFAYLVGATKYVNGIDSIKFALNTDKTELQFQFVPNFSSDTDLIDTIGGTISKVGSSSIAQLDSFIDTYTLPETSLSDEVLSSLSGKQAYTSTVTYHYVGNPVVEQKDVVVVDESKKQYTRQVKNVSSTEFVSLVKDEETGHAVREYIDYSNKVAKKDLGSDFNSVVYQPIDLIEKEAFRLTGEGEYTYFGYDGRAFVRSLTDYEPGEIYSVTLSVSNSKITALHAVSTTRYDSYSQPMYYEIDVEFGQSTDFTTVASHAVENKYNPIYRGLSSYSSGYFMYSHKIVVQTVTTALNYKTTISVVARQSGQQASIDTVIFDRESVDTEEGTLGDPIHVITGYYKNSEGLAPFRVTNDNKVIASGPVLKGKGLADIFHMDIAAGLFYATDSEDLPNVGDEVHYKLHNDVSDISEHIFGGDNVDNIIPSSLEMTVQKYSVSGYQLQFLSHIEYEFNGYGLYTGKETIDFSDYGTLTLPEEYDFSTFGDWVEPTTWEYGAYDVYQKMAAEFTSDQIALMPYLYQKEIEGHWGVDVYNDGTYIWASLFNDAYAASDSDPISEEYMAKFVALLKEKGFVEKQYPLADPGLGTQLYKDGLYVRVTNSLMAGIRFLVEIPQA